MSHGKLAKPIAIVDMANMRDDSASRRWKRGKKNYSSWDYMDSVISSLKNSVENLTVIPVFDAGLANNFQGNDIAITNHRKSLSYLDENFVYFMREHYIEADPLILMIASELGGFVISGDQYEKYPSEAAKIDELVFVPVKKSTTEGFEFFKSSEFYDIRGKHRNYDDLTKIHKTRTLRTCVDTNSNLVENDSFIREQVFGKGGIELRFWENYFRTTKQGEKEQLRDRPFANFGLVFQEFFKEKQSSEVVVKTKRRIAKKRKEQVVIFCDALDQIEANVDTEVQVVGKLGRSGEQIFLEWFRGDKAVLISDFSTRKDLDKNFIKISGLLSRGFEFFELEITEETQFEQLSFTDAVIHRLSRIIVRSEDDAPRRWSLPSLQWGRKVRISTPKPRQNVPPPPPGYRYRESEERYSDLDFRLSQATRSNREVGKDSDLSLTQEQPLETVLLGSTVNGDNDLSQQILEIGEDEKIGALATGRKQFELSRPPIFKTVFRKRGTRESDSGRQMRRPKWLLIFLLVIAAVVAYFLVDPGSDSTKIEAPSTTLSDSKPADYLKSLVLLQVANASTRPGSAKILTDELESIGYRTLGATIKDRNTPTRAETVVYHLPGMRSSAEIIAQKLGGVRLAYMSPKMRTFWGEIGSVNVLILLGDDIAGRELGSVAEVARNLNNLKCWGEIEKICVET